jgi:hypothetical protein
MRRATIDPDVPRWVRWFVAVFLVAFIACALAGVEAWPLTGWHLFSRARPERAVGLNAVAVTSDGAERPVPFDRMPYAYRGFVQVLGGFQALPAREQTSVCMAWAQGAEPFLGHVTAVRIYRSERHLSQRVGRRGLPPVRTLVGQCLL